MKNLILIFITFLSMTSSLLKAEDISVESSFKSQNYESAISLLNQEKESLSKHYNLGNAYYMTGNLAKAVAEYEMALNIKPRDSDTRYNLAIVKKKLGIKEESKFNVLELIDFVTGKELLIFTLFFSFFFLLSNIKYSFFSSSSVSLALVSVFFVCCTSIKYFDDSQIRAIVIKDSTDAKSGPAETFTTIQNIGAGTKLKVISSSEYKDWKEVLLADNSVAWMKASDIELITKGK